MRLLTAFAYLLTGTWLLQMAVFFYSSPHHTGGPGDGLYTILEQQGVVARAPAEAALFYLALTIGLSAMTLTLLARTAPHTSGRLSSQQTQCATFKAAFLGGDRSSGGRVDDEERVPMTA